MQISSRRSVMEYPKICTGPAIGLMEVISLSWAVFRPEKGPVDAIRIAQSLGIPLKIAAKVDKVDEPYFGEIVQPMLSTGRVEFIGEISEMEKGPFLRSAIALLFPVCWPEPFGLVMIEAMACGTPVLAYRAGAVPEVVDEGITGMIVDNIDQARIASVQVAA